MWILDASGALKQGQAPANAITLVPQTDDAAALNTDNNSAVIIAFESFADGRGFSLARRLKRQHGDKIALLASGHVLPDQARHAFQSGFDGVLISDNALQQYGEASWRQALNSAVSNLYLGERSGDGIWARRHLSSTPH